MTWRELAAKIREMSDEMLNNEAEVFIDGPIHYDENSGGLYSINGVVIANGWNYEKKGYTNWGFITIDSNEED